MNKQTKMQAKKVHLLYRAGRICLLSAVALLSLGSCRDDIQEPKKSTHEQTPQIPLENYIGKVDIALEATLEPMPDQSGRSLNFTLMDRTQRIGVDGKTVPAGTDYTGEVAPRMYLTEGSTVSGFLIFYHDSGQVLRQAVDFEVIEGVKKADGTIVPTAKNRVQFVGNINFPTGLKLSDEFNKTTNSKVSKYPGRIPSTNTTKTSGWHVMAMIGYQESTTYHPGGQDAAAGTNENRLLLGYSLDPQYRTSGSDSYAIANGSGGSVLLNAPCASAWMPLYITKAPSKPPVPGKAPEEPAVTGVNLDLHFKPQGVILQYDVAGLSTDVQDIRCVGLVSNVLDFEGYYDLNEASIKAGYLSKDDDGYGLPNWMPNTPSMDNLSMNYAPKTDAPLSSGDRVYPWDMPTLSSSTSPKLANWGEAGTHPWSVDQASVLSVYPLGDNSPDVTKRPSSYPWLTTKKLWTFYIMGGKYTKDSRWNSYKIFYFWGMPRTIDRMPVADKRATYLFASSHSLMTDEDAYDAGENGFDTWAYRNLVNEAIEAYNDLLERKRVADVQTDSEEKKKKQQEYEAYKKYYETDEGSNRYRNYFPGAVISALQPALQRLGTLIQAANRTSITPRTQPLMVLHQTNRTFPERKIYHAQTVIPQDLMLSEVIYQKHDGKNYSLLEVYNTSIEPIDLEKYAVVRLIPSTDGSHLAFRNKDGQPVESLDQALVLPLTALKGKADPFEGSALISFKQSGYSYDDPTKRAMPIYYNPYTFTTTLDGRWSGTYGYNKLVDNGGNHPDRSLYILGGQSILLGGSGYVNTPVMNTKSSDKVLNLLDENSWFKSLHGLLKANFDKYYLRYAYAYADGVKGADGNFGEGTLDYHPGDAFALVKATETGWQIVDATGPIGQKQLAFAGTYATFKAEMDKVKAVENFSQQRLDGVNHPFIAPYRTKRLDETKWSDDWNILTDLSKFTPGRRFDYAGWEHTFTDFTYAIRRSPIDTQFTTYLNARPTKDY
ncbi:hypothetical protein [Porphyromonas sp.]